MAMEWEEEEEQDVLAIRESGVEGLRRKTRVVAWAMGGEAVAATEGGGERSGEEEDEGKFTHMPF